MFNLNRLFKTGQFSTINVQDVSHLEMELLDHNGDLKLISYNLMSSFDSEKLRFFMWKHGIYTIPTIEFIQQLHHIIPDINRTVEIGGGNGIYGRAIGCASTDNYMQHPKNKRKFRGVIDSYVASGQPLTQYGFNVQEFDGKEAVRILKPKTVICSWVTQKYNQRKHHEGGNMYGVDFNWVINREHVEQVILIGNETVHEFNPVRLHAKTFKVESKFLFSRSSRPDLDRIYILDKKHVNKK